MARDSAIDFSVDQAQKLFGKGIEVIGRRTGIDSLYNYGREVVEQQEEDIRQGNYQPEYTMGLREAYTQGGIGNALGWLGEKTQENLATSAPALVGGLAAALTAPFSVPVAALIGGSTLVGSGIMGTGEVAQEMEDKTGEYNDAVAIGAGTIIGLLDRFGAGKVIPKDELLTMTGKQLIRALGAEGKIDAAREIGKRIGKATAFEAATESAQEGVSVGATALTGGEYTGLEVADKLLEGFVLGGTMGGGMTTGIEALRQGPGAVNKVQDMFSGESGPGGFSPQMAFAGASFSPDRAQLQQVPLTTSEILMNQGPSNQGSNNKTPEQLEAERIQKINKSTEKNLNATTDEEVDPKQNFFNQNMTGESTKIGNSTVSPLRIILTNLKKQNEGVRKTGRDIIGDLRASEKGNQGLVGFMGNYDVRTTEVKEKKAVPADGVDGREFGKAMKEVKGDYKKLDPSMYKLIDITKPLRQEVLSFNDDLLGTSDSVTQNRGGEAYNSGLEEFLVRNKNKELSYDEVIKAFDQTRPQVKLEIRSKAAGQNPSGQLVNANDPDAGNTITEDNIVAGVALETTQRLMQNFVDEEGNSLSDPRDFEVDSVAIVSHDESKETVRSGALENSGTIDSIKELKSISGDENIADVRKLMIGGGHDYHGKGAAYLRGIVVRRAEDGKLYLAIEEVQDDQSRIKEENLDVATPIYDLDSPDQTLERTWTERQEKAKAGFVPLPLAADLSEEDGGTIIENRRPASLHSFKGSNDIDGPRAGSYRDGRTRNIFDASEKQKIITMDEIEQGLSFEDSLTKLRQQREDKQSVVDEKMVTYADVTAKYDTLEDEVKDLEQSRILPRQNIDLKEMLLDDLVDHEAVFTGNINNRVKDPTRFTSFIGRDNNQDFYDLLEGERGGDNNNVIAPIIEATWNALSKEGKLKSSITKSRYVSSNRGQDLNIGEVQEQRGARLVSRDEPPLSKRGHEQLLTTKARQLLSDAGINSLFLKTDPIESMLYHFPGKVDGSDNRGFLDLSSSRITKERENDTGYFQPSVHDKHSYFEAMQNRTSKPEAFRKTIQMLMKEEINRHANSVLDAKLTEYILKNHIQFRKNPENQMPDTDLNELIIANYNNSDSSFPPDTNRTPQENIRYMSVDIEGIQRDVIERLGPKAIKDIDNFLDKELDAMELKIGFIPENGGFLDSQRGITPLAPTDENKKIAYKQQALRETTKHARESIYMSLFEAPFVKLVASNSPGHLENVYKSLDQQKKNVETLADNLKKDQEELRQLNNTGEKRRRRDVFQEAIVKRAKEFNYSPQELIAAYDRLDRHMDNTKPYKRDSAHSSQAQASRAIIKGAINQIPELGKIYGEPVVGLVLPAKTDLQNMSGRAKLPPNDGSETYQRQLEKHKLAGKTSYEVAPNIVKKQFQDALLDEAGNSQVQVEEGVEFNMVGKSGNKAKLKNPVQFILRLDPNSAGEKLARSKFVFKAKGGTVDLRKAV